MSRAWVPGLAWKSPSVAHLKWDPVQETILHRKISLRPYIILGSSYFNMGMYQNQSCYIWGDEHPFTSYLGFTRVPRFWPISIYMLMPDISLVWPTKWGDIPLEWLSRNTAPYRHRVNTIHFCLVNVDETPLWLDRKWPKALISSIDIMSIIYKYRYDRPVFFSDF